MYEDTILYTHTINTINTYVRHEIVREEEEEQEEQERN